MPTFNNYDKVIRHLSADDGYEQFLIELMKQELAERSVTGQKRRIKAAKFPSMKTLDEFDMTRLENVSESTVRQLASCDFIKQRQNIVSSRAVEESNSGPVLTGWETERGIWLETERTRRVQAQAKIEGSQVDSDFAVSIDSVVDGVTAMASMIEEEPADDTEYAREHIDSKALAEERVRKETLGIHMG